MRPCGPGKFGRRDVLVDLQQAAVVSIPVETYTGCLYGFVGDQVEVRRHIELKTTFTDGTTSRTANIRYLVVNAPSAYNILLGRLAVNRIGAITSTRHMKMKLPSLEGTVITIKSDQKEAKKCYVFQKHSSNTLFI